MGDSEHAEETVNCLIEIPKGSRNKFEWDEELQVIKLDRFLFSSVVYPLDYGFVLDTLGADGDPLDAMVCVSEPTFPGCVIEIKPIALFRMHDDAGQDDKVVGVPVSDPNWNTLERLDDLPKQLQDEIAHFFGVYKTLEQEDVRVEGWFPCEEAWSQIEDSRRRLAESRE